jgi:hypothetical protein
MADSHKVGGGVGNRGLGRKKGIPNKTTLALKEMILKALDDVGGADYLVSQAMENPTAFMTLVGKVLPLQVNGAGKDGEHVITSKIVREVVRPNDSNG